MIERDGYPFIIGALLTAAVCFAGSALLQTQWPQTLAIIFVVLGLLFALFFRSPTRTVDLAEGEIVSPADGQVIKIENLESFRGFSGPVQKISIFLSVFDVHVNWTPVAGKVSFVERRPGKFHVAFADKASEDNERTEIGIDTPQGMVVFRQIAGSIARRIVCRLQPGETVRGAQKFGMIKFGSRVEVIVAAGSETLVSLKQRVRGGQTVIARLAPRSVETEKQESNALKPANEKTNQS